MSINVASSKLKPEMIFSDISDLAFRAVDVDKYYAEATKQNFTLKKGFSFSLKGNSVPTLVVMEKENDEYFFCAEIVPKKGKVQVENGTQKVKKIGIIWDCSGSRKLAEKSSEMR